MDNVRTGHSAPLIHGEHAIYMQLILGREDEVVSDTALLPWFWGGLSVVSGLGPGLTRYSADAVPGCLANDPSAGSQVRAPTGAAG
jgi:hypothetical protein